MRFATRAIVASHSVLLLASLAAAGQHRDRLLLKTSVIVSRGDHALSAGNLRKAQRSFEKALRILPDLPEAHLGLGRVRMMQRRFDEAHVAFLQAEQCYRSEAANLIQFHERRYTDAQARASDLHRRSDILKFNIDRLETLLGDSSGRSVQRQQAQLSALMTEVRQLDEEVRRLEQIPPPAPLAEDGVPGEVYFHIGNALMNLDRLPDAVVSWEKCVDRSPEFPLAWINLAAAYWQLDRPRDARTCVERVESLGMEVNPGLKEALRQALD